MNTCSNPLEIFDCYMFQTCISGPIMDFWFVVDQQSPGSVEMDLPDVLLEDLKLQDEAKFDGLIISGDIMTHARWMEYLDDALNVLDKLIAGLGLAKERVYTIPGNHDYEWYEEKGEEVYFRKVLSAKNATHFPHEVHYKNFLEKFYGDRRPMIGEVFSIPGEGFILRLGLLNSCQIGPQSIPRIRLSVARSNQGAYDQDEGTS